MKITFLVHSRLLGYRPGQIIEIDDSEIDPVLRAVIKVGRHISLIDPLELPDGSGESTTHTKEHRQADGEHNGHKDSSGSRGSKKGASGDSGSGDGGDGPVSTEHSSSTGTTEGEAYN